MIDADVLVVGAGPAGATFALNLAPTRTVILIDRRAVASDRIGEALVPAARRLLTDMGLWNDFLAQGHAPRHGLRSVWGAPQPVEADGLRDPDGPGWHLDRRKFDTWLRNVAAARGAALVVPARLHAVWREAGGWRGDLDCGGRRVPVRARLLVDAGGRGSPLARQLGARRLARDRLVCGWLHGCDAPDRQAGLTDIEAEPEGWWYTAPLPDNRRVLAFHTDADLPAAAAAHSAAGLLRRAGTRPFLSGILAASGFAVQGASGFCAAHTSALRPACGDGWLAIGDAALGFDPLSSQGLFNALYTGLAGAEAADRHLAGDDPAWQDYQRRLDAIQDAYGIHLKAWYGLERRWVDQPFWQRRLHPPGNA